MIVRRALAVAAIACGSALLLLVAGGIVLSFYYRPTLEYAHGPGGGPPPAWLNGSLIAALTGGVLTALGGGLVWIGRRCWRI